MKQNRWKSPVVWASIAAQVLVILQIAGVWERVGIPESLVSDLVAAIIQLAVLGGVLNNPTDPNGY